MIKLNLSTEGELTAFPLQFEIFERPLCILTDFHLASEKIHGITRKFLLKWKRGDAKKMKKTY